MIEAIVFDFDGVIVDTETPDYTTWQGIYESYGVELERELWTGYIGGGSGEFDFFTHASSVPELRDYREKANAYDESPKEEALVAREEELYTQAERILQASAEEAHVDSHSRCRIARLRPVR